MLITYETDDYEFQKAPQMIQNIRRELSSIPLISNSDVQLPLKFYQLMVLNGMYSAEYCSIIRNSHVFHYHFLQPWTTAIIYFYE